MILSRLHRRLAALAAMLAIALQVFWPLIAQAQPKWMQAASVCSVGEHASTDSPDVPAGHGAQKPFKHCSLCGAGSDRAAQVGAARPHRWLFVAGGASAIPAPPLEARVRSTAASPARPRAPPASS